MKDGRGADFVEDTMSTGKGNAKYETVIGWSKRCQKASRQCTFWIKNLMDASWIET